MSISETPIHVYPQKHRKRKPSSAMVLAATAIFVFIYQTGWLNTPKKILEKSQPGMYSVSRFDDGDTIEINMDGTLEKIRFIGVDTPETHDPRKVVQCFGQAASDYTKNVIGTKKIRLESDPLSSNRDRYNRLLRYIYLPDGTLVNQKIISDGYGFAYTGFPFTKSPDFVLAQNTARENNKGLWNDCTPAINKYGGYSSNDAL